MDPPDRPQRLRPGPRDGWVIVAADYGPLIGLDLATGKSAGGSSSPPARRRSTGRSPGTPCTSGRASPPKAPSTLRSSTRWIWPPASNAGGPFWTAAPTSSGPPRWSTAGRSWWPTPSRTGQRADLTPARPGCGDGPGPLEGRPPRPPAGLLCRATGRRRWSGLCGNRLADAPGPGRGLRAGGVAGGVASRWSPACGTGWSSPRSTTDWRPWTPRSGVRRWQIPIGSGGGEHWPVLDGDTVFVASADDVIAVDAATGTTRWQVPVDPAVGPPVRVGGRLYVATRSRLLALDAASGRPLWTSARWRIMNGPRPPRAASWSPPPTAPCSDSLPSRSSSLAPSVELRGFEPLTPCMPCSFGLLPHPRSEAVRPAQRPSPSDRDCPLDTARDRCLWHAGGTAGENDDARTWRRRLPARPEGEARPR